MLFMMMIVVVRTIENILVFLYCEDFIGEKVTLGPLRNESYVSSQIMRRQIDKAFLLEANLVGPEKAFGLNCRALMGAALMLLELCWFGRNPKQLR